LIEDVESRDRILGQVQTSWAREIGGGDPHEHQVVQTSLVVLHNSLNRAGIVEDGRKRRRLPLWRGETL